MSIFSVITRKSDFDTLIFDHLAQKPLRLAFRYRHTFCLDFEETFHILYSLCLAMLVDGFRQCFVLGIDLDVNSVR
jgi:hypothetical protein